MREVTSAAIGNTAPIKALARDQPPMPHTTMKRAACRITRPTKPMAPTIDTITGDRATTAAPAARRTGTPSAAADSLPKGEGIERACIQAHGNDAGNGNAARQQGVARHAAQIAQQPNMMPRACSALPGW